jgi:hypothetical protein
MTKLLHLKSLSLTDNQMGCLHQVESGAPLKAVALRSVVLERGERSRWRDRRHELIVGLSCSSEDLDMREGKLRC